MFFRNVLPVLLLLTFFQAAASQTIDKEKPNAAAEELRKEAVAFLRETSMEVGSLRSLENRISFSSEMAGLMWFHDEKEAAGMYRAVITDFKQLLVDYDTQMNALELTPGETPEYVSGPLTGGGDAKTRLMQKVSKAMGVRQQVAMSLAEHDATLAFNFYYDTLSLVTNADLRKTIEDRDSYFEMQLIKQIAAKDPAKAAEFGRRSLAKGVGWTHVDLLREIYQKDDAKGAEFAGEIVKKFKDDKVSAANLYNLGSFLNMGAENAAELKKKGGKKPMFTEQDLRDLAEILAQGILQKKESEEFDIASSLALIEPYAPARATQIRARFAGRLKPQPAVTNDTPRVLRAPPLAAEVQPVPEAVNKTKKEQEEAMNNVAKLGSKELPKEEREKIVAQARKIINGMGNRQEKIMALSMLASQVTVAGDKELAAEVLKDAATLVNPSPKNYRDFMEIWFLASAYSGSDPEKAFPLLEDAIFRLNETLTAFIRVGEFLDVSGEMIEDGEVQVGGFGGSMMTGLTRELGIATPTLRNLAVADFGKTKALTNKFDRTEVRILAKMLILRAILGSEPKMPETEVKNAAEEF